MPKCLPCCCQKCGSLLAGLRTRGTGCGVSRGRRAGVTLKSSTAPLVGSKLAEGVALGATVLWLATCFANCCTTPTLAFLNKSNQSFNVPIVSMT